MSKLEDLTGRKFGMLTVIEKDRFAGNKRVKWKCVCECGRKSVVSACDLKSGHTKSCGCKKLEPKNFTHKMKHTRIYNIWCSMNARCYNEKEPAYKYYGKRGIGICEEWKNNFLSFYTWSITHGYTDDLSLDRIDVNGNYCPENCRWITMKRQQQNKTTSIRIEHDGEVKTLSEWCEITGINHSCAENRYRKALKENGFASYDDIFSRPKRHKKTV